MGLHVHKIVTVALDNLYTGFGLSVIADKGHQKQAGVTPGKEQTALVVHMKEQIT